MKLLAISDTHIGHPGWSGFGEKVLKKAHQLALEEQKIDVVLSVGDLVEPSNKNITLEDGLYLLSEIPATLHLWVAGNNDLMCLPKKEPITRYPEVLQEMARPYNVLLLDFAPARIGTSIFIGNFGYYDLTLWRLSTKQNPRFPSNYKELFDKIDKFHREELNISLADLFNFCQERLQRHLCEANNVSQIILATHTVPTPKMVLYGHSPEYDFQNAWMGWNDEISAKPLSNVPNLYLQFCGHTHRSACIERKNAPPLINLSGDDQPFIFDF